jgi:CRISPR-associated protein Cas2
LKTIRVYTYDVSRDSVRRRVSDIFEDHAVRVQKSVFEARLDERMAQILFDRAAAELGPEDSLRMYAVTDAGLSRSRVAGPSAAPLPEAQEFWLL